jgi:hypothetical protein
MGPVVPIFLLTAQSITQPQKSANYELSPGLFLKDSLVINWK